MYIKKDKKVELIARLGRSCAYCNAGPLYGKNLRWVQDRHRGTRPACKRCATAYKDPSSLIRLHQDQMARLAAQQAR